MVKDCGLYIIKDDYFTEFDPQSKMMDNKYENRPYYCGIIAKNGIVWMVPTSTQVMKYELAIAKHEAKYGESIFHYITKVKGRENAFLIGNAIPCTDGYIKKPFSIQGQPFVIQDKTDIKEIRHKLSKFLSLVRAGKLKPQVDILSIERQLLER